MHRQSYYFPDSSQKYWNTFREFNISIPTNIVTATSDKKITRNFFHESDREFISILRETHLLGEFSLQSRSSK